MSYRRAGRLSDQRGYHGVSPDASGAVRDVEQRRADFKIASDPRALKDLRARTREVLLGWGLYGVVVDAAVLAAHELTINALMHTKTPATLRLILDDHLRIEVSDSSSQEPAPCNASPGELEHGLGLAIVANLADAWGHEPTQNGKTVWCELLV